MRKTNELERNSENKQKSPYTTGIFTFTENHILYKEIEISVLDEPVQKISPTSDDITCIEN